jgi:hypothetical protein
MRKQQLSYRSILEPKLLLFCAGTADTNPETEQLLCSVQELSVLIFSTTQEDKTTDIMSWAFKIVISLPILFISYTSFTIRVFYFNSRGSDVGFKE